MKQLKIYSLFISFYYLIGCTTTHPQINWNIPSETERRVRIKNDNFKKQTRFIGPNIAKYKEEAIFIRAWKKYGSNLVTYQIYIRDRYYREWRFYNQAFDSKGNNLDLTEIKQDFEFKYNKYVFYEDVGINVDRKYLNNSLEYGISMQLYSKKGDKEWIYIPGGYIKGFLTRVDSFND